VNIYAASNPGRFVAANFNPAHVAPCQTESAARQVRENRGARTPRLLERARTRDDINHLASAATGSGVVVGQFQRLFLLAQSHGCGQPAEWARFVWQLLADQGQTVLKDGKALETPEENLAEPTMQAHSFVEHRLPILRAVGIVWSCSHPHLVDRPDEGTATAEPRVSDGRRIEHGGPIGGR
jgi:hypothetical protein